jgi:hypothetical protein
MGGPQGESTSSRLPVLLMVAGGLVLVLAAVWFFTGGDSDGRTSEEDPTAASERCSFPACRAAATLALARGFEGPSVEVDPKDPRHIVVTDANMTAAHCTFHVTFDGGKEWTDGVFQVPPGYTGCKINGGSGGHVPTGPNGVAFGPSGTIYATFGSALGDDATRESVMLGTSTDGGKSFTVRPVSRPLADNIGYARPQMSAAAAPDGRDRVLISFWQCRDRSFCDQALFVRSDDGGMTFTEPVIFNDQPAGQIPSAPIQAPDGVIYATFARRFADGPSDLFLARSTDGGTTFTYTRIESQPQIGNQYDPGKIALDPRSGALYVVFTDARLGRQQVVFRRSDDKGTTWSAPLGLSPDQAATGEARSPTISVAPNGRIDIAYYRSRSTGIDDVYWVSSSDGGVRFVHRQVNDSPIQRTKYTEAIGNWYPPDVASTDDAAFVAWSDTKNADQVSNTQDVLLRRMQPTGAGPPP